MTKPAARPTDPHACPHGVGPITDGSPNVKFGGLAAARVDDPATCPSASDYIANGAKTVLINWLEAGRLLDSSFHGGVVLGGLSTVLIGGPTTNYWTIPGLLAVLSARDRALADKIRSGAVTLEVYRRIHYNDPYYDGTKWTTRPFEAGGQDGSNIVGMVSTQINEEVAGTLFHESVHDGQPPGMAWRDKEIDAYTQTEQWTIDRGLPSQSGDGSFRKVDSAGNTVVDPAAVRRDIDAKISNIYLSIKRSRCSTRHRHWARTERRYEDEAS